MVLTARDESRGKASVKKLQDEGATDDVLFHQLDVTDAATVSSLKEFIQTQFGRLDILVIIIKLINSNVYYMTTGKPSVSCKNQ